MNILTRSALAVAGTALLFPHCVRADEPPWLSGNPFSRPSSEVSVKESARITGRDGAILPLDLQATLVGGDDKLANVGGRVLRPGEDVQGYRLLEVYEDRAVFVREGKPLTVYVKPILVDEND